MNIFLPLHLCFVGLWLGCVLTEALFERALLARGRESVLALVDLHKRVDLWVEIPAFVLVLLTGGVMLAQAPHSALLHTKITFGLLAVLANAYCVHLVFARARAAHADDWARFVQLDHAQHKWGAVVLLCMLAALACGLVLTQRP